jgi:hypothetical protein
MFLTPHGRGWYAWKVKNLDFTTGAGCATLVS